jgi:hypothetical protein
MKVTTHLGRDLLWAIYKLYLHSCRWNLKTVLESVLVLQETCGGTIRIAGANQKL